MYALSTSYSIFMSCMLFTCPLTSCVSVNNSSSISNETKVANVETSSVIPSFKISNSSMAFNSSVLSSSKQIKVNEDTSTKKSETMKKMNLIKANKVNKAVPTTNPESIVSTYRFKDEDDNTCILMTVDALISFYFVTNLNQPEESDEYVPDENKVQIAGDCSNGEKSSMLIKWGKSFALTFDFVKTPGGERWFVNSIQFNFNTKDSRMKHPNHPNTFVQAATNEGDLLFPTPVGRSFKCHREIEVSLADPQYPDLRIKLLLRELTLEPFIFKNDDFGPEYLCAAAGAGSFRSETAPFIFGSLLTLASLCTISMYAVYRYLKVNKVQYDAME